MKTHCTRRRASGFSLLEFIAVLVAVALLAVLSLVGLVVARNKAQRLNCADNLKEAGIAFETWREEHNGNYPMQVALTNSDAMKLLGSGNAYVLWRSIGVLWPTNWLSTNWHASIQSGWDSQTNHDLFQKSLYCPADVNRTYATNFWDFTDANVSYFFNLDAAGNHPQMILDGDDNLAMDGVQVKPGILNLGDNNSVTWIKKRHQGVGNIGLVDGSVQQVTIGGLSTAILNSTNGVPTNAVTPRWVIP
jgi:prepilin-type processing-associated H-X9-DG protein